MTRYAKRRDTNEPELVKFARELGVLLECHPPLDWWAWWRGQWTPVEIKRPDKEGWKSEYTDAQVLFLARCKERGARVETWRTEADVLRFVGGRVGA